MLRWNERCRCMSRASVALPCQPVRNISLTDSAVTPDFLSWLAWLDRRLRHALAAGRNVYDRNPLAIPTAACSLRQPMSIACCSRRPVNRCSPVSARRSFLKPRTCRCRFSVSRSVPDLPLSTSRHSRRARAGIRFALRKALRLSAGRRYSKEANR